LLVGHGAIRSAAMGMDDRAATPEEVREMEALVEASLDEGAWGLSFGLEYPPGRSAATEELAALARVVARRGKLVTAHVRNRDRRFEPSIDEMVGVAADAGARLQISHLLAKPKSSDRSWDRVVESLGSARARDIDVAADTIPYDTGPGFATAFLPGWAVEGGPREILRRLKNPADYARIRTDYGRYWLFLEDDHWDRLTVAFSDAHRDWVGERFDVLAERLGMEPIDVLLKLFIDEGEGLDRVGVNGILFSEEHVRQTLLEPTFAIASDGWRGTRDGGEGEASNHPNGWNLVPLILGHYVRDEGVLPLEEAIRKMTSNPAQRLGLAGRGVLEAGAYADVLVFDPATIASTSSYRTPASMPSGISHVLVNGARAVRDGTLTGSRAGRVL
jgi:N-acyl-D-amino-acid deacylase